MKKTIQSFLLITVFVLSITFLIWLPHILKLHSFFSLDFSSGFNTIYRNFDGLEYVVVAKTFYSPQLIFGLPQDQNPLYYASHFPLYPALISVLSPLTGDLKAMLLLPILFTVLSGCVFYLMLKDFKLSDHPLWMSFLFLMLPARWVIVHSVGSPEPLFIFFILSSLYCFLKFERSQFNSWIWLSALFGLLSVLTRSPGILLFISYMFYIHWKVLRNFNKQGILNHLKYWPFILMPLGLLGIFLLFQNTYGDFFAYFHSGDNIHLTFPPFQIFNKHQYWVGDIWLEDVVYIFLLGFLGGLMLLKQKLYPLAFFVLTYLSASIFIAHRDISRYTLPVMPLVLIAFEKVLSTKEFKIVMIILSLGIYLYAQNFIIENVAPVANLAVFN